MFMNFPEIPWVRNPSLLGVRVRYLPLFSSLVTVGHLVCSEITVNFWIKFLGATYPIEKEVALMLGEKMTTY